MGGVAPQQCKGSVRVVVLKQGERAAGLVEGESWEVVDRYEEQRSLRSGEPWLMVASDGSMVRTGELAPDPAGGVSPQSGRPQLRRRTQWRGVRLSVVAALGRREGQYGAVLGSPQRVGEQMLALAVRSGYGDNTWVHGVGDGAPWIAQQVAAVFPQQRYLLDRYHLLEHLHQGAAVLVQGDGESARAWVEEQVSRIAQGQAAEVVSECRGHLGASGEHPLEGLASYLESRREPLAYAADREEGLPTGSGVVQGGHRHVIQAPMKLPGAWWKEQAVNPMLALKTLRTNGQWQTSWN